MTKRLTITLNDDEAQVVEWMAKQNGTTISEELSSIFWCELWHLVELYRDEAKADA